MLTRRTLLPRPALALPDSAFLPLGFAAGDMNLYRYVRNSATNATDPSGLEEPKRPTQSWVTDWKSFGLENLTRDGVYILADFNNTYNCHAYVFGILTRRVDAESLKEFDREAKRQNFERVNDIKFQKSQKGKIVIAVYASKPVPGVKNEDQLGITHSAVSFDGGPWISKLGAKELVQHRGEDDKTALGVLNGTLYGEVKYWYAKDLAPPPHEPGRGKK